MDLTALIDVAIGLSLVYLGASLFVTIVNEFIAQAFKMRGKQLAANLVKLIDDESVRNTLKKNPALAPFFGGGGTPGSYVDANVLARLLVGSLHGAAVTPKMADLLRSIGDLPDTPLRNQLAALAKSVGDDVDKFVANVAHWVDQSLTMLGESYKKYLRRITFGIGLVVAVALNLDTLNITARLYQDKEARAATLALAEQVATGTDADKTVFEQCLAVSSAERKADKGCGEILGLVDAVASRNQTLGLLPIGWRDWSQVCQTIFPGAGWGWLAHWIGWLMTALAISLGAPFWFDLLNRLVNIRHGIRKPEVQSQKT